MRTTVDIEQTLLRAAKARAAAQDTSLSEIVQRALRAFLDSDEKRKRAKPFVVAAAGKPGGRMPSPQEIDALLHEDDLARLK